jgi:hypothetical protein
VTLSKRARRFHRRAEERASLRQQTLERFGPAADERTADRRAQRTPQETERILRELGIADRRRQDRRR